MAPPIAGNARVFSGHQPLPPAGFPAAVPTFPVAGSLPHSIKWDPRTPFYRFNPIPSLPVVSSPIPAVALSLPRRRRPPAACAASPVRRPAAPSPPLASQPPPLRRPTLRFARRLLFIASAPIDAAVSSFDTAASPSSPASPPPRPNFAGTPSSPRRPLLPPRRLVAPLHHHLHQHRSGVFHAVPSSAQPLLPAIIVSSSSPIVLVVDVPSVARLVVSRRRLRRRHRSGVFHVVLVPVQLLLAAPRRPLAAPVIVFVLASASSSLVPAASRLRPRIAAEAVPSPFVSVVPVCLRRARSSLSFPRLVAWW
nr:cell wall protein-like [Oryza sativa Japonica Group]BAD29156.1 cell wall protein-like [Oryza sativa Japonica Group]